MLLGLRRKKFGSQNALNTGHATGIQLVEMFLLLFLVLMSHIMAMIYFEKMDVFDAVWLTMTSATTVGYGDFSAKTVEGRISTILLLYVGGIAILAQVVAMYFEYRSGIRHNMLRGNWRWKMKNHVVFLNCPEEVGEEFFYRAISGMRKSSSELANLPIIIVSDKFNDGISDRLRNLNVAHVSKPLSDKETLESACVKEANTVVVLSKDRFKATSDSINFELVYRLRDMGVKGRIIAEAMHDENRSRLKKVGADNVLRPVRAYPELLIRTILAPGFEQVMETLFDSFGEECIRYEVHVECLWLEVIQKLTASDAGLPIAYEDVDGKIVNNPSSKKLVKTNAIFAIVNDKKSHSCKEIEALLKS
jgi:voltage-gated potassium channel